MCTAVKQVFNAIPGNPDSAMDEEAERNAHQTALNIKE
jgi:hypothetical protein